jgi:hypothetical protein
MAKISENYHTFGKTQLEIIKFLAENEPKNIMQIKKHAKTNGLEYSYTYNTIKGRRGFLRNRIIGIASYDSKGKYPLYWLTTLGVLYALHSAGADPDKVLSNARKVSELTSHIANGIKLELEDIQVACEMVKKLGTNVLKVCHNALAYTDSSNAMKKVAALSMLPIPVLLKENADSTGFLKFLITTKFGPVLKETAQRLQEIFVNDS